MTIKFILETEDKKTPSNTSISELTELLKLYENLFKSQILAQNPNLNKAKICICASEIFEGSIGCVIKSNEESELKKANYTLTSCIEKNNISSLDKETRSNLINLADYCKKKKATVFLDQERRIKLTPNSQFAEIQEVQGETTLYGTLISIGNAKPAAKVQSSDGYSVNCKFANKEQAITVAPKLYNKVAFRGIGTWNLESWKLEELRVVEILEFQGLSNLPELKYIAERWNGGSYEDFMETIR